MRDASTVINTVKNQLAEEPRVDRNKAVPKCRCCMYHHPEFKYRKCLLSSCPFGKGEDEIFRKIPLKTDPMKRRPVRHPKAVSSGA